MGTNYYARILPTKERKDELKKAIDNDEFTRVKSLVEELYGKPSYCYDEPKLIGGEVHLGKVSAGWKFLWNPNLYEVQKGHLEPDGEGGKKWVSDGFEVFKIYDLTKESIKAFIDREDVVIYDEDWNKEDKEEFWNMALNWCLDGFDGESYGKKYDLYGEYRYRTDYCSFLEKCGYKLCAYYTDFYSDGLRFSTTTDFS